MMPVFAFNTISIWTHVNIQARRKENEAATLHATLSTCTLACCEFSGQQPALFTNGSNRTLYKRAGKSS